MTLAPRRLQGFNLLRIVSYFSFIFRPKSVVQVDVHENFPPKSPKLTSRNVADETSLPYGYENVLPKSRKIVDEKSAITTIVYDKSRYQGPLLLKLVLT